jgi:hypothetical protein
MSQIPPQQPLRGAMPGTVPGQVYVAPVATGAGGVMPDPAPHREADDKEEVYYEGSPMLRGEFGQLFLFTLIGVVLIATPLVIAGYYKHHVPWWLTLALIVAGIVVLITPIILVKRTRYRVTNYRVDYERGWLSTTIDTMELWHVEDLKFHQSFWEKIMGLGTIDIMSHDDTTPNLLLRGIPHARQLFTTLQQRVIAVKRSRGVLKVDSGT